MIQLKISIYILNEYILRGNRVLIDKPEKKEEENKLDLILSESDEKDLEKDMMKEWTHLNVCAHSTSSANRASQ